MHFCTIKGVDAVVGLWLLSERYRLYNRTMLSRNPIIGLPDSLQLVYRWATCLVYQARSPRYFASQSPDCLTAPSPCQQSHLNGKHFYIVHTVTQLLTTYQYVTVIALDFSKAFDTVRHSTLLEKMADLDMPDEVYNWLHWPSTLHKIRNVIVSPSGNIYWNNSGLCLRSSELYRQLQRFNLTAVRPGLLCKYADDT